MLFHLFLINTNLNSLETWYVLTEVALVLRIWFTAHGLKLVMLWWFRIVDTKLTEFLIQFIFFIVRFVLEWVNLVEVHLICHVLLCKLLLFLNVILDPAERVPIWCRLLMVIHSPTCCCGHDLILLLKLILIYHPWEILTKLCWILLIIGHVATSDLLSTTHLGLSIVIWIVTKWILRTITWEPWSASWSTTASSTSNHITVDSWMVRLHIGIDLLLINQLTIQLLHWSPSSTVLVVWNWRMFLGPTRTTWAARFPQSVRVDEVILVTFVYLIVLKVLISIHF